MVLVFTVQVRHERARKEDNCHVPVTSHGTFHVLNLRFLIYKIGLLGDRNKGGWGEVIVNKVLWGVEGP